MKTNTIAFSILAGLIREAGLTPDLKKNWVKIEGAPGVKVYVPLKEQVGEIHISNWTSEHGVDVPPGYSNGNVRQFLDMTGTAQEVAERFKNLLEEMKTQSARPTRRQGTRKAKQDLAALLFGDSSAD